MASYQVAGAEFCREPSGEIIVSVPVGQTEPEAVTLRIPVKRWVELVATVACPQHERDHAQAVATALHVGCIEPSEAVIDGS